MIKSAKFILSLGEDQSTQVTMMEESHRKHRSTSITIRAGHGLYDDFRHRSSTTHLMIEDACLFRVIRYGTNIISSHRELRPASATITVEDEGMVDMHSVRILARRHFLYGIPEHIATDSRFIEFLDFTE